jgi:hypothetical protein
MIPHVIPTWVDFVCMARRTMSRVTLEQSSIAIPLDFSECVGRRGVDLRVH